MRFLSFEQDGVTGVAVMGQDGNYTGLLSSQGGFRGTLDNIVRTGDFNRAADALNSGFRIDPGLVSYRPPLERPGKVLCVGLNYADHAAESRMEVPPHPTVFARFSSSFVAHGAPLVRPKVSEKFDYEGELVAVVGKRGREISEEVALDHVCGYSIFNDGSIRDYQFQTTQWTVGKNFDRTGAFGPIFVTADELPVGASGLRIMTTLNGDVVQDANTSDLIFDVRRLVSHLSVGMALEPGDIIVTGTPSGVGMARSPALFMQPGDVCEISIEGIGTLRNSVVAEGTGSLGGR